MRALVYDPKTSALSTGGAELVSHWRENPDSVIWADFESVSDSEREELLEGAFGLHPLAVQDALRDRHPPKVERFGQVLFVMLRGLDAETTDIDFGYIGLSLFIGSNFLLTRHTGPSPSTDWAWEQATQDPRCCESTSRLALLVTDRVVRRYLPILLELEPRLDGLEHEIFDEPKDVLLEELTSYKTNLRQLTRIFTYHALVVAELRRHGDLEINVRFSHELNDIDDQVKRCNSLAELYYHLASDLVDAYLANSAHRLNQIMKVLTIITVIFVPLSFLAGIYGMNFENMPELKSRSGYFVLLGIMGSIVWVQLLLFRRKRWI